MFRTSPHDKARVLSEQAGAKAATGDLEAAASCWRKAIAIRQKAGLGEHASQKDDLHALAAALATVERFDEAEAPARAALDAPGIPKGRELAARCGTLSTILKRTGRPEAALPLACPMVAMLAAETPTPQYAHALAYLAVLYVELRRPDDAEIQLARAIEVKRASVDCDDATTWPN